MKEKLPFELSEWLKDRNMKVFGENDMPAKIIAWDRKCIVPGEGKKKPVVALVQYGEYDLNERLIQCTENGLEYTPQHGFSQALWMLYEWKPKFKPGDIIIRDDVHFDILSYDDKSGTYRVEREDAFFDRGRWMRPQLTLSVREQDTWQVSSRKRVDLTNGQECEVRTVEPSTRWKDSFLNAYLTSIKELFNTKSIFLYNGQPSISGNHMSTIKEESDKLYKRAKELSKDEPLTVNLNGKEVNVKIVPVDGSFNIKFYNGKEKQEPAPEKSNPTTQGYTEEELLKTAIDDVTRVYRTCGIGTYESNVRAKAMDLLKRLCLKWKPTEKQLGKLYVIARGIPDNDDAEALYEIYEGLTGNKVER